MASTNKTTNYNLSQFEGTDKPSWEADYNADMLSIDQNLKSVSDIASGASGDITSLDDRLTTAEGNISTNANDITALDGRLDTVESTQGTQGGDISSIQAEQIVQNTGIESATRLGYNLARPYDNTNVYSVGDYVLFNDTLYKCTTAILVGETFDPTKWLAIKATDEIAAGGYTLPIASANVLGGVKVGNNLSIDANGVLSASGGLSFNYSDSLISITGTNISNVTPSIVAQYVLYCESFTIFNALIEITGNVTLGGNVKYYINFNINNGRYYKITQNFNVSSAIGTTEKPSNSLAVYGQFSGNEGSVLLLSPNNTYSTSTVQQFRVNGVLFDKSLV